MPIAPDRLTPGQHVAAAETQGVVALLHRAVDDARTYALAEVDLVKARVNERVGVWKVAVAAFAIAGVLALATLIALLVGLIMTLATLVGPGGATAIVCGTTLLIAGLLGWFGVRRLGPSS